MTTVEEEGAASFAFWLRFWRWLIAIIEIGGGVYGIFLCLFSPPGVSHLILITAFILFVASAWAGVQLARQKPYGVAASIVIQVLQLLQISVPSLVFSFVSGALFVVGANTSKGEPVLGFSWLISSRFLFSAPSSASVTSQGAGVNVLAALAILCLVYVRAANSPQSKAPAAPAPSSEEQWPPAPHP